MSERDYKIDVDIELEGYDNNPEDYMEGFKTDHEPIPLNFLPSFDIYKYTKGKLKQEYNYPTHLDTNDTLAFYKQEAARYALLTSIEEQQLGLYCQRGKIAERELREAEDEGIELSPAEIEDRNKAIEQGRIASHALTSSNLQLVLNISKHYDKRGVLRTDLVEEGNFGLIRAVDRFDPTRGFKFSTYATWWIRQAITRAIANNSRTVRLPVHLTEFIGRISQVSKMIAEKTGETPSAFEIGMELGVPIGKVKLALQASQNLVSLDQKVKEDDDFTIGDSIEDNNFDVEEQVLNSELSTILTNAFIAAGVSEREAYVLLKRQDHTLIQLGNHFGLSRERIRQLEQEAYIKIKNLQMTHPDLFASLKEYLK